MLAAAQWLGERLGRRAAGIWPRLRGRIGQRGIALILLGTGKIGFGIGYIAAPLADPSGLQLLTSVAPLQRWAWVWVGCGTVTLVSAFLVVARDRWGFVTALIPPTIWGSAYGYAAATGVYTRGFYVFVWYLTSHVGLIIWASRVPEFEVPHHPTRRGSERGPHS